MTTPISVFSLVVQQFKADFLNAMLDLAETLGLPVTSWRPGDPTRTLFTVDAETFETLDAVQTELAKSAFTETAEGDWLKLRAKDVFGVDAEEATFATATVTVNNSGGGLYDLAPGGLIFLNSTTGATYQNQALVTIAPLASGFGISVIAQAAGSAGSADEGEIDTIVSPALTGVTVAGSTAAVGTDEQSDQGLRDQCTATLGALSPDGPADAYEFVAGNVELTGVAGVTRRLADGDNATGTVTVYVATATAALDGGGVASIQAAIDEWAKPLGFVATVVSGTPVTVPVNLTLTPARPEMQSAIETAIDEYFASIDFGGTIAPDAIQSAARAAIVAAGSTVTVVACTSPASPTALSSGQFPVRGTVALA